MISPDKDAAATRLDNIVAFAIAIHITHGNGYISTFVAIITVITIILDCVPLMTLSQRSA